MRKYGKQNTIDTRDIFLSRIVLRMGSFTRPNNLMVTQVPAINSAKRHVFKKGPIVMKVLSFLPLDSRSKNFIKTSKGKVK
jgi:hypothetical protein